MSQFGYDPSRSTSSSGAPSSSRSSSPLPPRRSSSSQQSAPPMAVRGSSFFDMDDGTSSEDETDSYDSGDSEQTPTTSRHLAPPSRALPDDLLIEDEVANEHCWELRMQEAQDLEAVFTNMLGHKGYPVYTTTTLASAIRDAFGATSLIAPKGRSVHLKLAPAGLTVDGISMCKNQSTVSLCDEDFGEHPSAPSNASNTGTIRKWMDRKKSNARRDLYDVMEDRQSTDSHSSSEGPPSFLTVDSKAAGRLGLTAADLSGAQQQAKRRPSNPSLASSYNSGASTSTQSPGLIAWPHTFIPMSAAELEMHACKHMHTLIGCKLALINYVQQFVDSETHEDIGPDDATMLHELSEYERCVFFSRHPSRMTNVATQFPPRALRLAEGAPIDALLFPGTYHHQRRALRLISWTQSQIPSSNACSPGHQARHGALWHAGAPASALYPCVGRCQAE